MARLPDHVRERFLAWLCTIPDDRWPKTQTELAEELGCTGDTLSRLKKDPDFLRDWEHQYRRTVGSPERAQHVLEQLYQTATDRTDPRQVQAAKQYLEAIDAVKPKKLEVSMQGSAREMSDEQLLAILGERAADELSRRA